jgi:hypothetical protein
MGALSAGALAAGCGGGLEESHPEALPHEDESLLARQWHDRVVRLEGEAVAAERNDEPCPARCALATRACELTERICTLAERDDHDEGTRLLCDDARARCTSARGRGAACGC